MFISEIEDLEDITDTLVFEDEPSIFTEEYAIELVNTALHLMDEYMEYFPHVISEPNFHDILLEEIKDIFYIQMEDHIDDIDIGDDIEDDMNDLLEDAFNIFITTFHPDKSQDIKDKFIEPELYNDEELFKIEEKIQKLREIPQPVQRTPEWYKFRWNLITASNAYKAFETQSSINQLVYEKCQPLKTFNDEDEEIKMVNTNTAMHWGQKYEPLSVMYYEQKYGTKVEDFGCIQHPTYKFLGASPDGIIVNKESDRYGRMLEIKNPVSREITGIPKKEYWTQMQLQMEVCGLDECDFLETKFIEYPDYISYINDTSDQVFTDLEDVEWFNNCLSKDNKNKGQIIYFHTKEGKPFYVYKPLDCVHPDKINEWQDYTVETYENKPYNYIYMKTIYWKLDVVSCILVLRKRDWFKNNIGQLENVWKIIEKERISGYEHRAPVKKQKKELFNTFVEKESQGCLLKFNKIIKLDTTNNGELN
jgi:putative phage-type endonuclease